MTSIADLAAGICACLPARYGATVDYVLEIERVATEAAARRVVVVPASVEADPVARVAGAERVAFDVCVLKKATDAEFPLLVEDVRKIARILSGASVGGGFAVASVKTDPLFHPELWLEQGLFAGSARVELIGVTPNEPDAGDDDWGDESSGGDESPGGEGGEP